MVGPETAPRIDCKLSWGLKKARRVGSWTGWEKESRDSFACLDVGAEGARFGWLSRFNVKGTM